MHERFAGFFPETLQFFQDIKFHNDKAWFEAHRDDFEAYVKSPLEALCLEQVKDVTGKQIPLTSGSTDINLPLNRGIPALCFGAYRGGGAHTREEWIDLHSLEDGLAIWLGVLLRLAGEP